MTERSVWKIQELREDGKWYRMFGRYYDTKAEATEELAGWSLRVYQQTGNFAHDAKLRVKRESA